MGRVTSIFWTFLHLSNGQYYLTIPFLLVPVPHLLLGYKLPPDSVAYMFILLMSLQYGEGLVRTGGLSSASCWLGGWDHAKAYTMSSEGSHHVWQGMGAFPGTRELQLDFCVAA